MLCVWILTVAAVGVTLSSVPQIKWLGVRSTDIQTEAQANATLPFSQNDQRLLSGLLTNRLVQVRGCAVLNAMCDCPISCSTGIILRI